MPQKTTAIHDPDSLLRAVEAVRSLVIPAQRISDEMRRAGVQEMEVECQSSLKRALVELGRWGAACEKAWIGQRSINGDLAARPR